MLDAPGAVVRLKHMLLCKVMAGKAEAQEVPATIASKAGLRYAGALAETCTPPPVSRICAWEPLRAACI